MLTGKKTYFFVSLMVFSAMLKTFGLVDKEAYEVLMPLLGGIAIACVRHGISKQKETE